MSTQTVVAGGRDAAQSSHDLGGRIRAVAMELREGFEPVIDCVSGHDVRPIDFAKRLKIDNSLAGRLLRAMRTPDPLAAAREAPAPQGLRIILAAAARTGLPAELRERAERGIQRFEDLIGEFPDGRAALDAAVTGWVPELRDRSERAAKQAVYKSMSQIVGYRADVMATATIIQPSADGSKCDALSVYGKWGLRRLRTGSPILTFFLYNSPIEPDRATPGEVDEQRVETIDGASGVRDGNAFLLKEYCRHAGASLKVIDRGDMLRFALPRDEPPVNVPVSLVATAVTRNAYLRYADGDRTQDGKITIPRLPCRLLIEDVFLRDDVYPGFIPRVIPRLHGTTIDPTSKDGDLVELDHVELNTPVQQMGWGAERIAVKECPDYAPAVRHVFDRVGWRPERFRAYRCRVVYPVPFVSLTTWFDLPTSP